MVAWQLALLRHRTTYELLSGISITKLIVAIALNNFVNRVIGASDNCISSPGCEVPRPAIIVTFAVLQVSVAARRAVMVKTASMPTFKSSLNHPALGICGNDSSVIE